MRVRSVAKAGCAKRNPASESPVVNVLGDGDQYKRQGNRRKQGGGRRMAPDVGAAEFDLCKRRSPGLRPMVEKIGLEQKGAPWRI